MEDPIARLQEDAHLVAPIASDSAVIDAAVGKVHPGTLLACSTVEMLRSLHIDDIVERMHVVQLPMRVKFRGITTREAVLIEGPHGWGEFAPFQEYSAEEASWWLAAGLESAFQPALPPQRQWVDINATIPAVAPEEVPGILARFPGCRTIKVKVAEPGDTLNDDIARVEAVRAARPGAQIRIDANHGYSVEDAALIIRELAPLDYAEQPVADIDDLARLTRMLRAEGVPARVAADESIRRAEDPLALAASDAVDCAVLKIAPLGGVRRTLALSRKLGFDITLASALDTAVGIGVGAVAATYLPPVACGLGTGSLFVDDVVAPVTLSEGAYPAAYVVPEAERLAALRAPAACRQWWLTHLRESFDALRLRLQA